MKKLLLILMLGVLSLISLANEVNYSKYVPTQNIVGMYSDSVKFSMNYENKTIYLNFDKYNKKIYKFNDIDRLRTNNTVKFETLAFNDEEIIGVTLLFYSDGKMYVVIKNFKSGGIVKYNLNS